jgi:nicotinate phosphoribosyltransferase
MKPIVQSLLETDLYKLTMQQAMLHQMPANLARYVFNCRNDTAFPLAELAHDVNEQLDALCSLKFRKEELAYVGGLRFMKADYIEFLRLFQLNREFIQVRTDGDRLVIEAAGPQLHVMPFELYVLPIVQELYQRRLETPDTIPEMRRRLDGTITRALARLQTLEAAPQPPQQEFALFDFGLRRRYSADWHREVVETLRDRMPHYFKGTSNMHLARELNLTPIGTMAHEWLQTFQAMPGVQLRQSLMAALDGWVREYRGDLGIALTDVVTTDAFLRDFDLFYAKLFDGLRHDSGDPLEWAHKINQHYRTLRIDPNSKRKVFSDGLRLDTTALDLYEALCCKDKQRAGFGIGTSLSNDSPAGALNIVMKLLECNGMPTAKISDVPGKTMCQDAGFLSYLRRTFRLPEQPEPPL